MAIFLVIASVLFTFQVPGFQMPATWQPGDCLAVDCLCCEYVPGEQVLGACVPVIQLDAYYLFSSMHWPGFQ